MVLGTFLSAPIMFVSSKMILVMKSSGSDLDNSFSKALFDTGILSAVCCVSYVFLISPSFSSVYFCMGQIVSSFKI